MRRKKTDPMPQPPIPQAPPPMPQPPIPQAPPPMPCPDVHQIFNAVQAQVASAEIGRLQGALREAKAREMPPRLEMWVGVLSGLGLASALQSMGGILSKPGPEDRLREALERAEALEREGATPFALDEARAEVERLREKADDADGAHSAGSRAAAHAVSAMLPAMLPRLQKMLERVMDDETGQEQPGLPSTPEGRAQLWKLLATEARRHGFGAEMLEQVKQVVLDARGTAPSPAGTAPSPAPEAPVGPATAPPREKVRRHRATRKPSPPPAGTAPKPAEAEPAAKRRGAKRPAE